ncbi:histidine phosphatase family protein [Roseibium polysiphoniae]|uniref:SixA phosphatase family protein n=1 Tax=Roseibium polysiphoniae TaxID=2571221 RepID=UPI003297108B
MLQLFLLRHAKSDWGNPELKDFDRPLNSRGRTAARTMGAYMEKNQLQPDLILCSSSQRTRETLAKLLPHLRRQTEIRLLNSLYDESEDNYLPIIRAKGGNAGSLMVIGHNPATEQTAHALFAEGDRVLKADMELKYPSGALAIYSCPITDWSSLEAGTAQLEQFIKPRSLQAETS